jgi:hypothetical protein
MLDGVRARGSAMVLRGEAGIGKSVLLGAARDSARRRGLRTLSTAGVEAESSFPYAGLHQLLRPLLGGVDRLPVRQRSMLLAAFGDADHDGDGDLFLVALAALGLLSAEAARRPVLVTVDDAQWLDSASHDVIAFVGRRLDADPIVMLGAVREGYRTGLMGLPEHVVGPLDDQAARTLLHVRAPSMAVLLRRRLLTEAAGNPLALVELPALSASPDSLAEKVVLPLSARLEQAFADRLADAPPETAALLVVFAADVTSSLREVLAATQIVFERPVTAGSLQPAFDAGLLRLDDAVLRFRHPLVRAAVYQSATGEQRRAAHAALARVVADQPDRRPRHRADAATGPDEDVARDLEAMGARALKRGAALDASTAMARAASLSTDPTARVRRLLGAAEPAFEAGRADLVRVVVEQARRESLTESESARVEWLSEIFDDGSGPAQGDTSARILHLMRLALRAAREDDADLALALLSAAAIRCWWTGSDPDTRRQVVTAVESLDGPRTPARRIVAIALADPLGRASEIAKLITLASSATATRRTQHVPAGPGGACHRRLRFGATPLGHRHSTSA